MLLKKPIYQVDKSLFYWHKLDLVRLFHYKMWDIVMVTPTPPLARIHAFLITKYKYSFVGGVGSDFLGYSIFLVNLLGEKTSEMIE